MPARHILLKRTVSGGFFCILAILFQEPVKTSVIAWLLLFSLQILIGQEAPSWAIVIHGGAGNINRQHIPPERAGALADNFASIENSQSVFVPQGLLSVYLPDRAEKAMESYSRTDLPQRLLINRDSYPLTCLYSLLLATKQSGSPVTKPPN